MTRCSFRGVARLSFCAVAVASLATTFAVGITGAAPVLQDSPCEVAFVVKPLELLESEIVKMSRVIPPRDLNDPQGILLRETESVRGVLALPDDFSQYMDPKTSSQTFKYYIEYTLKADSRESEYHEFVERKKFRAQMVELISDEGDRLVYSVQPLVRRVVDAEPVELVAGYQIVFEGKKVTIASHGFQYDPKNLPAMTDPVSRLLKDNSQSIGFVAFDAKSAGKLMESMVREGKGQLPSFATPYLELLDRIELVTGFIEVDKTAKATVRVDCARVEDAEQLAKMVGELVTIAKFSNQGTGPSAEMYAKVLDTVKSKVTQRQVEASIEVTREAAEQSGLAVGEAQMLNNQRRAVLGMHNYESAFKSLPFHAQEGQSDEISWRVRVLPYFDQLELYRRFDLSQPWDSPENLKLLQEMPMPPALGGSDLIEQMGKTTNLCWVKTGVNGLGDIKNGLANTICFVQSDKFVNWTENNDVTPAEVVAQFKSLKPGEYLTATFYDGHTRKIPAETDPEEFLKMLDLGLDD